MNLLKKILIVGPSWIGDMVMAQSLFITLKHQNPDCLIDVLAPSWSFALLDSMPEVNKAIAMPLTHGQFGLQKRFELGKQLREQHYEQAIVLPNSWKSALIPFFAKISQRTGYVGECRWGLLNDARHLNKNQLTQTVQRFVALANAADVTSTPDIPVPVIKIDSQLLSLTLDKYKLNRNIKILALCPGAEYGPAKRWSEHHFAAVAEQKIRQGWQVCLFGSEKDIPVAKQIKQHCDGECHDFTGQTSISEAIALMSVADVVISNDSGLMHIAAALNKTLIALYGSSDPSFTPPLNKTATIVSLNLDCSPCFKRDCPLGHLDCLVKISPEQVLGLFPA